MDKLVEYILENLDKHIDKAAKPVVKWLIIYSLVRLGIGMALISFLMFVAWLMIQVMFRAI
jgi:multisubunit Na+/H+ antiporter MnhC subunit